MCDDGAAGESRAGGGNVRQQVFAAAAAVCVTTVAVSAEVVIETVTVGNPGNAADTRYETPGYGGVDYTYFIGKFEITAGQYVAFLNAVAGDDTYGLYNEQMSTSEYGCRIERSGSSPSYTYSVGAEWADRPVNFVSWGEAARFCNWLHNGQPTGAQHLFTTEDGSYYLNGATSDTTLLEVVREPDARWVIPSEDEWYKAAYHYNDGATGNYYEYPTSSDSVPESVNDSGNLSGMGIAFIEGGIDPGNYATYDLDGGIYGIGSPYYKTEVGEWEHSSSPYGTFDQGGNIWEWNEAILYGARGARGGSFDDDYITLLAAGRYIAAPTDEFSGIGFRVAGVSWECGNGIVEAGEECDDGNDNDNDYCYSTCERNWDIPAVSEWGLVTLALLGLTAGTLVFAKRKR